MYLGVRPVTEDGRVDGSGRTVDWVVEMRRFDGGNLFDRLAEEGRLDDRLIDETAAAIVRFHGQASPRRDMWAPEHVERLIDGVEQSYPAQPPPPVDGHRVAALVSGLRALSVQHAELIQKRRAEGFVRDVHGDLHLRNIVLWRGRPTLFDAIEFDERIRCCDCLYDFAFLLMDLLHRDMAPAANRALNGYLEASGDIDGLALMPFFLALRASIRGHVAIASAENADDPGPGHTEAADYVALATRCLDGPTAGLVAVAGLSGTGKSTVARGLAPEFGPGPGALILRSDVIRKELAGVPPTERLDADFYTKSWSERVYRTIADRATAALAAGWPVIADAMYGDPAHREALAAVAHRAGVPFAGLWLEAPREIAIQRVARRRNDASDADAGVAAAQSAPPPRETGWQTVAAGGTIARTIGGAHVALDRAGCSLNTGAA